jgi:TPR repeat protein
VVVAYNMSCAVEWYTAAAGLGNASAQFVMGVLHTHGLFGVRPSAPAALAQWVFGALGGSLEAVTALGLRHATGDGVPKSCGTAVSYLEAPARARADAVAASVGLLQAAPSPSHTRLTDSTYESWSSDALRGEGQVVTYYHTAAERGDTNAHVALAHLYLLGVRGVLQDLPAAAEHFHAAADVDEKRTALLGLALRMGQKPQGGRQQAREHREDGNSRLERAHIVRSRCKETVALLE